MDDATEGLTQLSVWSSDFYTQSNGWPAALPPPCWGVALIFVVWALAMKKENARSYLLAWIVCVIFTVLFIL